MSASVPATADTPGMAIVRAFCQSFRSHDAGKVGAFLAEAAVWENVPIGITHGRAAICARLAEVFARTTGMDWEILAIAETAEGQVLTERIDRFHSSGRLVELRLMGIFELADGKIRLWRDYFDLVSYQAQLGEKPW